MRFLRVGNHIINLAHLARVEYEPAIKEQDAKICFERNDGRVIRLFGSDAKKTWDMLSQAIPNATIQLWGPNEDEP